jgi:sigma-B regulation protein RsbU (phosphoserine phosphatase)
MDVRGSQRGGANGDPVLQGTDREALLVLKDRALDAAAEGITIADARLPGMPLIYVNTGFERLTGYSADSVLGRNCRFLQGPGTDPATAREIRRAIDDNLECLVEILNYRKDGASFWNRLSITPVVDGSGQVTHFIGVQSDVTLRRNAEEALRQAKSELETVNRRMKMELDMAARIQQTMFPPRNQSYEGVTVSWLFRPCVELAGDTLNVIPLDDHQLAFYVIDVSGHGVGSALLSVTLQRWLSPLPARFRALPRTGADPMRVDMASPSALARQLNQQFPMMTDVPQYFTMLYGILDTRSGSFRYVSAGHPGPILVPGSGSPVCLPGEGFPIGLLPGADYDDRHVQLQPGDRLVLYSDGVPDTMNSEEVGFGVEKLKSVLSDNRSSSLPDSLEAVMVSLQQWRRNNLFEDDITLLGVEYVPS